MTRSYRSRRRSVAALSALLVLAVAACSTVVPNTTLTPTSEFGAAIDDLFDRTLLWGTIVFVLVEAMLVYILVKFRHRPGDDEPRHVHGNTTLEIAWTLIPAVVLAVIAVPTVRTIFETQAEAKPDALRVEVIGHQWWWEFRYPQYGFSTANELYLPVGRMANFALQSADVLHSFWVPQLGGKRDLITNHTNYVWWTPESTFVWNGFCAEYCGASHANMRFRVFTVSSAQFDQWVELQKSPPAFAAPPALPAAGDTAKAAQRADTAAGTNRSAASATAAKARQAPAIPAQKLPQHVIPTIPLPEGLTLTAASGDPMRGAQLYRTGACIGCHVVKGVSFGVVGPDLTHVGSRTTIAAGMYPNDFKHLALWIKNAPAMKPGSLMPALGRGGQAPGGYTDQQVADIAAYLLALK